MTNAAAATPATTDPISSPSQRPALAAVPPRPAAERAITAWLAARRVRVEGYTLDDVVGLVSAKREVQSLIARLRHPEQIRAAGGELPRSILFYGPPGTGKTTLAKVVASALAAGDRGVPFFELSGGDLTASRLLAVRDHFAARAADAGYAVAFVDEVDVIALQRHHYAHTPESRRALYALLTVLDGIRETPNVLWLFASNSNPGELDHAVTRAGRMGWHVETTYPSRAEREALFRHFARGRRVASDVDWQKAAEMMGGQTSGADIRQVLDDALALALADADDARADDGGAGAASSQGRNAGTDWPHLVEAIQRRGRVSDRTVPLSGHERVIAAAHEAGHATAAALLGLPLRQIVLDETTGGGHTDFEEDTRRAQNRTDGRAQDTIAVLLAGHVAEGLLFAPREVSLGSASDLEQATSWALLRIDAGLDPGFPLLARSAFDPQQPPALRDMAAAAAAATVAEQRARAERLLRDHEPELQALAQRVAEADNGQLGGTDLRCALRSVGLPIPDERPEDPHPADRPAAQERSSRPRVVAPGVPDTAHAEP